MQNTVETTRRDILGSGIATASAISGGLGFCSQAFAASPKAKAAASAQSVTLFGINFAAATRPTMRQALRAAGARVQREDDSYLADIYDGRGLLDNAKTLTLLYEPNGDRLGRAIYSMARGFVDSTFARDVASMVTRAYGRPARSQGFTGLGVSLATWNFQGGIQIEVFGNFPSSEVELLIYNLPISQRIKEFSDSQDRERQQQNDERQRRAF